MEYRQLGTTGVRVSEIAYGTFPLGTYTDTDAGAAMIHAAMDRGVNFIDTANVYFKGRSEEIVGAALKGRRQEVVLASKFGHPMGAGPNERGSSRYHIYHEIEDSLRRLQTDYMDVYYFHIPDPTTPLEESIRATGRPGAARQSALYRHLPLCRLADRARPAAGGAPPAYALGGGATPLLSD